ncbi:helix-turn-helix domain-containing protein [Streptomyces sp. DSM 44917]|uniref:Helix-turn-helix domain-containing protein n=1 Tax=Streptomyces boetiae TaxID=3075541 RepID=A0ABU2LDB0_9ACTN|nr:helix-turn-helix domain-containing protein [Streptomyces sp. DSM 44917]MDT0309480.1 helix-turn-helix domain-containing protein [Streptomyces sp. DSM 44917]
MNRTRLAPASRREQLLGIGAQLFAERPYDDVSIDEIASLAGVSRGLMYRYFATKRELFREVVRAGDEQILALTEPDPSLPLPQRVAAGVDAYLRLVEANAPLVRAATAGAASADEEVRAIIADGVRRQEDRILGQLQGEGLSVTPRLRVTVRGWVLMTRALTLDWLETREVPRDELRRIVTETLLALAARAAAGEAGTG